jgi:hypothetical protein
MKIAAAKSKESELQKTSKQINKERNYEESKTIEKNN